MTNTNPETGIRYGTAYLNNLADWVFEEFFYHGVNVSYESALEEFKAENPDADDDDLEEFSESYSMCADEENYELEKDGLKLGLSHLGGAAMIWVFESPHTTKANLCSPCVPNAGNLDSQDPNGFECYTLPPEWFREEGTR